MVRVSSRRIPPADRGAVSDALAELVLRDPFFSRFVSILQDVERQRRPKDN